MARLDQFNVGVYTQDDANKLSEAHSIVAHYKADHRGMTTFAALHALLVIADETLRNNPQRQKPIPVDRSPMERRMGASDMSQTDQERSGTSQGGKTRKKSAVRPPKRQDNRS